MTLLSTFIVGAISIYLTYALVKMEKRTYMAVFSLFAFQVIIGTTAIIMLRDGQVFGLANDSGLAGNIACMFLLALAIFTPAYVARRQRGSDT